MTPKGHGLGGISPCKIGRQPIEIAYGEVVLSSVVPPHALPVFCSVSGALFPSSMQAQLALACMTSRQLIRSLYAFPLRRFLNLCRSHLPRALCVSVRC